MDKIHCFFEQSGTFKNEFKKLGYKAYDYDIQNEFNETDYVIDLFTEIEKAYKEEKSIFDNIKETDMILAFFPCVRFEDQIQLHFRGCASQMRNWSDIKKLERDLELHKELAKLYSLITKLTIICLKRKIPLVIENPYSAQHYLKNFWAISATFVDKDRSLRGDYYKKPTQYWFVNCSPKYNLILEPQVWITEKKSKKHT